MRNRLNDNDLRAIAECGRFKNLRRLDLRVNSPDLLPGCSQEIGDVGSAALASSPELARLRHLNLYRCRITARGVETLLNAPYWRLDSLELGGYNMGQGSPRCCAKSPRLARLTELGFSFTPSLGGNELLPLAESPHLSPLCVVDVRYCNTSGRPGRV